VHDSPESEGNRRSQLLGNTFPGAQAGALRLPGGRYGAAGHKFCAKAYDIDPSKLIGSIKETWEAARLRAAQILKGKTEETDSGKKIQPLVCRLHDRRHTPVSRMLNAGTPIAKIAKIVGWSASTMVLMAMRYKHFSLNDLRGAVESISESGIEAGSPVFSPVSEVSSETNRPN
jgi:hypothetical protein